MSTAAQRVSTLRFHEHMEGWISFDELSYNQAMLHGRQSGNACSQTLEIEIDDLDRFIEEPEHAGRIEGTVQCERLGGKLRVMPGSTFNLFVDFEGRRHKRMLYRLYLSDPQGRPLTLSGFKDIADDSHLDVWGETSTLFVRILSGHLAVDPDGDEHTVATGILRISRPGFLRMLFTFRGDGGLRTARGVARFNRLFVEKLEEAYGGVAQTVDDFPVPTKLDGRWQGHPPGEWHDLDGPGGLRRRIIGFPADDPEHTALTLHNIRGEREPWRGPVLLAHGGGVRANLFYGAPSRPTLVQALVADGYDVWLENWRASIDLPARSYTLDQAAVYDHPAAVRTILAQTGAKSLKAIGQCQGSTSLTMSIIAGLVPEVTTFVAHSVSLYIKVPKLAELKCHAFVPPMSLTIKGLDPQWAIRAPSEMAGGFARLATLIRHRDCDNDVCKVSNYMYGVGPNILWRHDNLDPETHDWISREFGYCPFSLLKQIGKAQRAGYLVPAEHLPQLPESLVDAKPQQPDTRIAFIAGSLNRLFLPLGQRLSFEHFDRIRPGFHSFTELPGYTHLDIMFGRNAHRDTFPLILHELDR